jgi:hypothetical protein
MTIINNNEHTRAKATDSDIFWEKARHDGIPIPVIRAGGGQRLRRTKPQSSDAAEEGEAVASSVRIIRTTRRATTSNSAMSLTKSVLFLVFFWSFILPRMKRWIVECCRDISAMKRSLDAQSSRRRRSSLKRVSQLDNNNSNNNSSGNSIRNVKKATTSTVCIVILLLTFNTIGTVVADRDIPSDFFKQPIVKTKKNIFQRLRLGKQRGREQVGHAASGSGIRKRSKISTTKSSTIIIQSLVIIGIGYIIWLLMMQHGGMKRWISDRCRYISERIHSSGTTSTSRSRRRVKKRGEKSRTTSNSERLTPSSSVMDIINLIEEDSDNDVDGEYSPLTPATGDSSLSSRRRNSSFLSLLPSFSSVRERSANLPSTVDVFESVVSDMGMVDSTRPFSNVTRTSTRVSRNEHSKSFSTVMAVTEHPHEQRRMSIDTLEDDTSQIPTMMSITTDQGKRGHDDDQKEDGHNSALARKLSTGSSRVRSRR